MEQAGPLECLLKVLGSLPPPLALRKGGAVGAAATISSPWPLLSSSFLSQRRLATAASSSPSPTAKVGAGLDFAAEDGHDGLFSCGVLGGDIQKLLRRSRGLVPERMDEHFAGGAAGEGIDDVGVRDIRSSS